MDEYGQTLRQNRLETLFVKDDSLEKVKPLRTIESIDSKDPIVQTHNTAKNEQQQKRIPEEPVSPQNLTLEIQEMPNNQPMTASNSMTKSKLNKMYSGIFEEELTALKKQEQEGGSKLPQSAM